MTATVERYGATRMPPHRRVRPARRPRALLVRAGLFGCAALVAALGIAGALVPPAASGSTGPAAPAALPVGATWIGINRPLQLFGLAGSPYARLPLTYEARRRSDASARQDVLTYGGFAANSAYLTLSLERGAGVTGEPADLVVAVARRAGAAGIAVTRAGQAGALATRFGAFEVAPVTLRTPAAERACLGFRLAGRPAVVISGLACGLPGRNTDQAELACALKRLDLVSAGDDAGLQGFFVEAERRRSSGCSGPAST